MVSSVRMAFAEYKRWLFNPRIVLLIALIIFARESVGQFLCEHAKDMDINMQIFEPYIALCNSYVVILVTPIFYLVMMADFPIMKGSYMWAISRMGKKEWIFSQFILSVMCGVTIQICLFISSFISCFGYLEYKNTWSEVITQYYLKFPEKAGSDVTSLISGDIYNQMTPMTAMVYTFTLSLLSMILLSMLLMCGKIYARRYLSFAVCLVITGVGATFRAINIDAKWVFPSANAVVGGHFYEFADKSYKSMGYSYEYFVILILVIIFISYIGMKRGNICRKL